MGWDQEIRSADIAFYDVKFYLINDICLYED